MGLPERPIGALGESGLLVSNATVAPTNPMKRMGQLLRRLVAIALLAGGLTAVASSQSSAGELVGALKDEAALKSLGAGIDAYRDGALEVSVEALSDALAGKLSQRQSAEALYYRGLAYRELGKPGQGISDLATAMSIKDGLSKAHRKEALRNLAGARREAGLAAGDTVVTGAPGERSRIPIPIPPHRVPVPTAVDANQVPQPDTLTTGSIGTAPVLSGWGALTMPSLPTEASVSPSGR